MKRILVVDDEASIAETLSIVFEDEGFRCAIASNGADALAEARRDRPDLVVLDLMMPVMDGRATLQALRADPALREVPVVVMSAAPALFDGLAAVPEAFLEKPFDIDAMVALARRWVERGGASPATGGLGLRSAPADGADPIAVAPGGNLP